MYRRISLLMSFTLMLTTAVMAIDTRIARAGILCWLGINCPNPDPQGTTGDPTLEEIAQLEFRLRQGQAVVDDYLKLGDYYITMKNFSLAEDRFTRALQLAKNNKDKEGQAIAQFGLGEVYAATGRRQAAIRSLRETQKLYESLGDTTRARLIQQRQINLQRRSL